MTTRHGSATVTTPSDREILITRKFDAPARLVYEAWTTPEHVRRWWILDDTQRMTVCDIDLRVGGAWRYVTVLPNGFEVGFHGVYREIVPNERLVTTEVYEGFPDGEALNTWTLEEHDGVTTLSVLVLHSSKEHRDGHLDSGMEGGMQLTMNHLEDLIAHRDSVLPAPESVV
jgi:uncharacterized protein YndB with AHSA1/START domain